MRVSASADVPDKQHTGRIDGTCTAATEASLTAQASLTTEASASADACTELKAKALQVVSSLVTENLTPQSIFQNL